MISLELASVMTYDPIQEGAAHLTFVPPRPGVSSLSKQIGNPISVRMSWLRMP